MDRQQTSLNIPQIDPRFIEARSTAKEICSAYFKDEFGNPFILSNGQADIFNIIYLKLFNRNQVIAPTQYGKSSSIAMALIIRAVSFGDRFAIVSGSAPKAKIIMDKVIEHTFNHYLFVSQLELDSSYSLDRLRRERSKTHITWKRGGSIRIFSAKTRESSSVTEALTGFGSPNIIEDEASLVPDKVQSMVMRMLGGNPNAFLAKIGNPFNNNHFKRTWQSPQYNRIFIDYNQALKEGRFTEEFIEEMRPLPFFDILYECKFPNDKGITTKGYRRLIPDEELEGSYLDRSTVDKIYGKNTRLGCDFAGGGRDRSAYAIRNEKFLDIHSQNRIADTMQQIPVILNIVKEIGTDKNLISLDYGGLGQGVGDRLTELDGFSGIGRIHFGSSAPKPEDSETPQLYKNMRAYMYYQLLSWIRSGGKILSRALLEELKHIYYKADSEGKIQIEPKEEMRKRLQENGLNIHSPDRSDAAALTFSPVRPTMGEEDFDFI